MQGPSRALQQKYANYTGIASSYLSSYWFLLSLCISPKRSLRPNKNAQHHQQQNLILFLISPLRNCSTPAQDWHTPGHMMWVVTLWVHTIGIWKQMSPWYPKKEDDIPCIPCYWYDCSNPRQGRATAQKPCQNVFGSLWQRKTKWGHSFVLQNF